MKDDHFGQKVSVPAVPLQRELNVGPGRVAMVRRVDPLMVAVLDHLRAVKELKEPDRHVPVELRDPPRPDLKLRVKPVAALVGMIVPGTGILLQSRPLVETGKVAPIRAVDSSFVEVSPFGELAELSRQNDVGVEVENPVLAADLIEAALNQPSLVERAVARVVV
jgi:hypothetical protein